MNLGKIFYRHVLRKPDAIAIVDGDIRRTYGDWYEEIRAVAGGLRLRGLKSGDHFVVVLSNRYETATLYWACQMLGLIFTPFNWRANDEEVAYVLDNAEAVGVVFEERSRPAVGGAIGRTVGRMITFDIDDGHFDDLRNSEPVDGPSETDDTEICLMLKRMLGAT